MRERWERLVWRLRSNARAVKGGVPFNQRDRREAAALGGVCVVIVAVLVPVLLLGRGSGDRDSAKSSATLTVIDPIAETRAVATGFATVDESDELERGSEIRTDDQGFVELEYTDGSRTRLGPGTLASIDRLDYDSSPKRIAVGLDLGRALQRPATTATAPPIVELRTESAIASAKGAEFTAECESSSVCRFIVLRGTVDVAPSDADAVRLSEHDSVTVDHGALVDQRHLNDLEIAAYPWIAFNRSYDASTPAPPPTSAPSGSLLVATDVPVIPPASTRPGGRLPASALTGKLPDLSGFGTPIELPVVENPIGTDPGPVDPGPGPPDPTAPPTPTGPEPTVTTKPPIVTTTTTKPPITTTTTTTTTPPTTSSTTTTTTTTTTSTTMPDPGLPPDDGSDPLP